MRTIINNSESFEITEQLMAIGRTKSYDELRRDPINYFPKINYRLWNNLAGWLSDIRLCDITKEEFLAERGAGLKGWINFCNAIGKDPNGA